MALKQQPFPPIIALELPQPEGPSRNARISILHTLKPSQLSLLNFQTITLLLHEVQQYNDSRLSTLTRQLKRQKKIQEILALTFSEFLPFSLLQVNLTLAIVDRLDDKRLATHKSVLQFQRFSREIKFKRQKNKPKPTFTQNLKNSFPFSLLYPKQPNKKDEEQQLQLSFDPQRTVGVKRFNFKYD